MVVYPRSFDGQFLIGHAGKMAAVAGGVAHATNDLAVVTIGKLPVTRVCDAHDRPIGMLLGYPVDYRAGKVVRELLKLDAEAPTYDELDTFVEDTIYRLGGAYLFVLDHAGVHRVYLDAGGSMSAVFDPERRLCAATTGLLLDEQEYTERFRQDLFDYLRIIDDGWFPAGLTAHHGISRMLGNHYLDLDTGRQVRHWPMAPIARAADPDQACMKVNAVVAATMQALLSDGSVATTLTAGNETRLILAACREFKDSLRLFTLAGPQELHLDAVRASDLARRFDLRHERLPVLYADQAGADQWLARSSHCIGGLNMRTYPSVAPMLEYSYFTGGVGGETGRGFFWRPGDAEDTELTAASLVARTGMPLHEDVVSAVDAWLQALPEVDTFLKLDLAFIELRLGCWGFSQTYATPEVRQIQPLIARESFVAMLSLDPWWHRENRMILRCIELAWPELLALPINKYGDYRDLGRPLARVMRNPRLIVRKLRKKFG